MHDVAWRGMCICVRSKDAQKQLARTSLICTVSLRGKMLSLLVKKGFVKAVGLFGNGQKVLRDGAFFFNNCNKIVIVNNFVL